MNPLISKPLRCFLIWSSSSFSESVQLAVTLRDGFRILPGVAVFLFLVSSRSVSSSLVLLPRCFPSLLSCSPSSLLESVQLAVTLRDGFEIRSGVALRVQPAHFEMRGEALVAGKSGGAGTGKEEAQARKRQVFYDILGFYTYILSIVYSYSPHTSSPLRDAG